MFLLRRTALKKLALFLLLMSAAPLMAQNTVAIRAGGVVDPATGRVARNQVILVENGKIKEIGPNVRIPKGAGVVDLSNEWVAPGLMDAHVHLTLTEVTGGNAPFESFYLKESSTYRGLRGLRNAQDLLRAGFTTVRELGNDGNYEESLYALTDANWNVVGVADGTGAVVERYALDRYGRCSVMTP